MSLNNNFVYVDASSCPNPGPTEYRGLYDGEIIFSEHIGYSSINCGEFLAIVTALMMFNHLYDRPEAIYSDSKTAMSWVRKKRANTEYSREKIEYAENWLKTNKIKIPVLLWNSRVMGENPADYGRKPPKTFPAKKYIQKTIPFK